MSGNGNKKGFLQKLIHNRLGGYKQQYNEVREDLRVQLPGERTVAVIGAGIAGLSAALILSERGFRVTLKEKNGYLGGKVGSWPVALADGSQTFVEHGFHAFFRQYYNLMRFLEKIEAHRFLVPIDDYLIETRRYGSFSFKNIKKTPVLNMLSMAKSGIYSLGDMMKNPKARRLLAFLSYDSERTFDEYDDVSFKEFADAAQLPGELRIIFNTFSRAFFSEAHLMSVAEIIKSFHSYFLSNDAGLIYEYLNDDYEISLLEPFRSHLVKNGARIQMNRNVSKIERHGDSFNIDGETYDYVILASDVKGSRAIAENSDFMRKESRALHHQLVNLKSSQRYAVLRLWLDSRVPWELPPFVITDKIRILDSISIYPKLEAASAEWARKHGGSIVELHSYAVPDDVSGEGEVRGLFLEELYEYHPELRDAGIIHEHLQLRDDFTAFHVGLHKDRPGYKGEIANLFLAGDWVKIPVPAMLMEAACTSAILAANAVLDAEGLREEPLFSVPLKGLFAKKK